MVSMLMNHGLYSIMQVTKRRYWPQGMLETGIVESVDANYGGCFTMKKDTANGKMFVCAFRAQKVKAFVSSCGTARLTGEKTFKSSDGIKAGSVDAANNLRDNLASYHDIASTGRRTLSLFGITNKLEMYSWERRDAGLIVFFTE
ncbi:hypothetical protein RMATCC62417_00323 [Rhizopus microsporus]|nr:hypothetical protein RMATCC62417_00323 [Rhizopus microsporus]